MFIHFRCRGRRTWPGKAKALDFLRNIHSSRSEREILILAMPENVASLNASFQCSGELDFRTQTGRYLLTRLESDHISPTKLLGSHNTRKFCMLCANKRCQQHAKVCLGHCSCFQDIFHHAHGDCEGSLALFIVEHARPIKACSP